MDTRHPCFKQRRVHCSLLTKLQLLSFNHVATSCVDQFVTAWIWFICNRKCLPAEKMSVLLSVFASPNWLLCREIVCVMFKMTPNSRRRRSSAMSRIIGSCMSNLKIIIMRWEKKQKKTRYHCKFKNMIWKKKRQPIE